MQVADPPNTEAPVAAPAASAEADADDGIAATHVTGTASSGYRTIRTATYVTLHATAEVWDPATGSFGPAGSLSESRDGHTATLLLDGRVLVVGGEGGAYPSRTLDSAEVWEPAKDGP